MTPPIPVSIVKAASPHYSQTPSFSPPERYPEYPFPLPVPDEQNCVYPAVRQCLALLGLDAEHNSSSIWNPLAQIIRPGDNVVLKPNFIMHRHWGHGDIQSVITNGSVIRAIIDYVIIALQGRGRIIVADAPMGSGDFAQIAHVSGLDGVRQYYREQGITVELIDLRTRCHVLMDNLAVRQNPLAGDPAGYAAVDLKEQSAFEGLDHLERLRGSDFECEETIAHHTGGHHAYYVARSVLEADVVINLPKLKTHTKAGVTLNLKNVVGINGDKNWIPHFRVGGPTQGGDEFPGRGFIRQWVSQLEDVFKQRIPHMKGPALFLTRKVRRGHKAYCDLMGWTPHRNGGWYGNDTLWRSILDLNRVLLYADRNGIIQPQKQRRLFSVVDGIVAGEHNGPLYPHAKPCGVLLAAGDLLAVDMCAARLMGFDYSKIPHLARALEGHPLSLGVSRPEAIAVHSNIPEWSNMWTDTTDRFLHFIPPEGWRGHIET